MPDKEAKLPPESNVSSLLEQRIYGSPLRETALEDSSRGKIRPLCLRAGTHPAPSLVLSFTPASIAPETPPYDAGILPVVQMQKAAQKRTRGDHSQIRV